MEFLKSAASVVAMMVAGVVLGCMLFQAHWAVMPTRRRELEPNFDFNRLLKPEDLLARDLRRLEKKGKLAALQRAALNH